MANTNASHDYFETIVLPVKVGFAQNLAVPTVAFVGQRAVTVDALDAFRVPRPVQHVQKELIHNGFVAARATHHQTATPATASACETMEKRVRQVLDYNTVKHAATYAIFIYLFILDEQGPLVQFTRY